MRAAWLVIVLVACGGGRSEPVKPIANEVPRPPADAAIDAAPTGIAAVFAKMTSFTDRMCACKDKACADAISDEMSKWGAEMAKDADKNVKVTEDDAKRMAEITERFAKCMTAVMMPPSGSGTGSGTP